jgi:aminocarboxymuconate-semialdehyde decarboxylase
MAARIIDCDSHFMPKDVFDDVDPRFGDRAPRLWWDAVGRSRITYPDREANLAPIQRLVWINQWTWRFPEEGFMDVEPRLAFMDRLGIETQLLVPAEQFLYDVEPELATSVCQSYNNAISRVLRRHPGRFLGMACVPMQSPVRAVDEIERAIGELGLSCVLVFGNVNGENLDEPKFWPVYERIERLNVPLIIHPSRSGKLMGIERLTKFHLENSLGFLYEATLDITSFIVGGVLDRFPRLRIGLLETGAGYLPTLMDRLEEVYDEEGVDKLILKRPTEYLSQFWLTVNVKRESDTLAYMVKRFGSRPFLIGSDFPHWLGGSGLETIDALMANPGLTAEDKERILGLNAVELFALGAPAGAGAVAVSRA